MQPLANRSVYSSMRITNQLVIALLITATTLSSEAQVQDNEQLAYTDNNEYKSLFSLKNTRGYAGIHAGALALDGQNIIAKTGGSAAVIFNQKLAVGFTGTGFIGFQNTTLNNEDYSMTGGYGGILIEPIIGSKKAIHLSFPVSFGIGENQYFKDSLGYREWEWNYRDEFVQDFVYIEPGVNIEMNLTKFMRFGVTGSYMLTDVLNTTQVANTQLDGLSISANIKLGWFK